MKNITIINENEPNTKEINIAIFKRALLEGVCNRIDKIINECDDKEIPPPSLKHKIQMNRFFREQVGSSFVPFPEEDGK